MAGQPPPDGAASAQLAHLHVAAIRSLSEAFDAMGPTAVTWGAASGGAGVSRGGSSSGPTPLSAQQLEQLKQAQLVVDDGRTGLASAFMVLGDSAEGLRPIVIGPDFPLRPLPMNYAVGHTRVSLLQ